ncbi:MAG TPA: DUF4345 family protein [Microthrixaceae bacterium]|nr:DUF4345 family protein [Microthrixaceae bacterium]
MHQFAVIASMIYFVVFGAAFVFRPEMISRLGLEWTNAAGKTEVRCYYGAISWALAAFLGYLLSQDLALEALTGMIFLATAVLVTRTIGSFIDGGWSETYNRQAVPIESAFVALLLVFRIIG